MRLNASAMIETEKGYSNLIKLGLWECKWSKYSKIFQDELDAVIWALKNGYIIFNERETL